MKKKMKKWLERNKGLATIILTILLPIWFIPFLVFMMIWGFSSMFYELTKEIIYNDSGGGGGL